MKTVVSLLLGFLLISTTCVAQKAKVQQKPLTDKKDKISYSVGFDMGKKFVSEGVEVNSDMIARGLKDALSDAKSEISDEEMESLLSEFQQALQQKQMEKIAKEAEKNKMENEKFFDENSKKEGVKTTASGLQYKVLASTNPNGKSPKSTNTVKVHYKGSLLNGKVFDSSYDRKEPIEFPLDRVIKGWTEGVQLMKEGDTFEFYIPSELGYGARGAGGVIPPNAALIFVVELLEVK